MAILARATARTLEALARLYLRATVSLLSMAVRLRKDRGPQYLADAIAVGLTAATSRTVAGVPTRPESLLAGLAAYQEYLVRVGESGAAMTINDTLAELDRAAA